jgi:hypothetical protein
MPLTKNSSARSVLSKVPEVTLMFWIIKIAATTLDETGGDAVSMSMHLAILPPQEFLPSCSCWPWAPRSARSASTRCFTGRPSSPPPPSARHWPISSIARWASAMRTARRCCSLCLWHHWPLASNTRDRVSRERDVAKSGNVLLGHHHVFPNPGPATWCCRRRLPGQTTRRRRAGIEPLCSIRGIAVAHCREHLAVSAESSDKSSLTGLHLTTQGPKCLLGRSP